MAAKAELYRSITAYKSSMQFYIIFYNSNPNAMPGGELVSAADANLGDQQTVATDFCPVSDGNQVAELGSFADNGVAERPALDPNAEEDNVRLEQTDRRNSRVEIIIDTRIRAFNI